MTRLNQRFLFGAVILVSTSAVIVLRTRNAPAPLAPNTKLIPATSAADSSDVSLATMEPTRALMPLIPPDPVLATSGSVVVIGRVIDRDTGVTLVGASIERKPLPGSATNTVVVTHSDEQGAFEFETPLREASTVRVSASGHAAVELDLFDVVRPHENMTTGEVFRMRDVQLRRGVQPVVRVLDIDSKPVAGAKIVMCEASLFTRPAPIRSLGVSDEHGEWTATEPLSGSTQGTYVMAVSGKACGATPLALQRDGSRGERLDVVVRPAIEVDVQAYTNVPVSRPLAEVAVRVGVYPSAMDGIWRGVTQSSGANSNWLHAKTDAEGVAHLLVPRVDGSVDSLSLSASLEGFDTVRTTVGVDALDGPVKLRLQPSASPTIAHTAMGSVLDARGHPVPGSVVRCEKLTCVPDKATGFFRLDLANMPVDRARMLTAEAPGYALRKSRALDAKDPIVADFVFDPLTCLRGRVVDEKGRGIAGVEVHLDHTATAVSGRTRADGTFCLAFPWQSALVVDELSVRAGWPRDLDAPYEQTIVSIDDPQHVDIVLKARSTPIGSVSARVLDDESSEPAPVVRVFLMARSSNSSLWMPPFVTQDRIITDIGSFRAANLQPGTWEIALESSDGRVGAGTFEISATHPSATTELRVGPRRSIVAQIVPEDMQSPHAADASFVVTAEPAASYPRVNMFAAMSDPFDWTRRARVGMDGTFTFDHMEPGSWKIVAEGARGRSERTVMVTTRADVHLTMHAKPRSEPASLQLTNLDGRFDGPLYVRLERDNEDPVEFVADPMNGRAQTFPVASGETHLVVYPMHDDVPDVDAQPIARLKLDIAAGATEVVALYPR